ncbi:hypothetical protein BGAPBR_K0033 (plasmid) [Borreliella garinii PBr]|uniref:Uncharacterized protein n=1 Tax=Borreliella garinii PBr TaxID=498743 RepID=B8F0R6_BORGR|nr:hypothetical protein BGAPBR_K0033 [Borreliella garinii PBr]
MGAIYNSIFNQAYLKRFILVIALNYDIFFVKESSYPLA